METQQNNFYKTIVKATGAFGVFQVLRIIVRLFVGKIAAVFLGPSGLGFVGFIDNTLSLIASLTGFGLNISGVRFIASSKSVAEDNLNFSILKKAALLTGFLGFIVMLIISPILSKAFYNVYDKFYYFIFLGLYFIFFSISNVNNAIIQGKRQIKLLLYSNFICTLIVALVSYILYYWLKEKAVVPVFISTACIAMFTSGIALRTLKFKKTTLPLKALLLHCKPLVAMGFLLSLNVIFGQICYYLLRIFLKYQEVSASVLGYFEVANVFLVSYLGLVFSAMSNDFYPRLTTLKQDKNAFNVLVNQQMQVAVMIVTPIVILFYIFQELILKILYTAAFFPVLEILSIGFLSVILKAIIWPLGFIPLACNDNKEYFRQNIMGDFLNVFLSVLGFYLFGLKGLGIAVVLNFGLFLIYLVYISQKKYQFEFQKNTVFIIVLNVFLGVITTYLVNYLQLQWSGFIVFCVSVFFSLWMFYSHLRKLK